MHKIDHPTATPGGLFTIGDPVGAVPATVVTDDWLNAVQGELVAVIEGAGLALSKPDNAQLLAAIQALIPTPVSPWRTGDVKLTMQTATEAGWIICNDGTIGNAGSSASTRANADCEALFALLWNNVSNTHAPVSGGRGANAAADWAANKTIGLTKMLGRALAVAGAGASLTARTLGEAVGAETHVLTTAQLPAHVHEINAAFPLIEGAGWSRGDDGGTPEKGITRGGKNTGSQGSGEAHNNMQPTTFLYAHIKL